MPIVIPSKNIFQKENQKVINNRIDKISVEENIVGFETKEFHNFSVKMLTEENAKLLWIGYLQYSNYFGAMEVDNVSYSGMTSINNVYSAVININLKSDKYIYTPSINVNLSMSYKRGEGYEKTSSTRPAIYSNDLMSDTQTVSVSDLKIDDQKPVVSSSNGVPISYCKLSSNPSVASVKRTKRITLTLLVPLYYNPIYNERTNRQDSIVFTDLQVSVKGDEFSFEKTTQQYGSGTKNEEIYSNEYFQLYNKDETIDNYPRGTYFNSSKGEVSVSEYLSEKIISEYKEGKETATIRCSVSDYYTENGSISISTKKRNYRMSFNIGDEVIPMIYGDNRRDYPMSLYKDGSQKVFRVVGLKFIYDGAVWQELTLQEV